jgi:hypothetical protein
MGKMINEHEQCGRCGRKLKTEASRQAGFGPVCKRKWEAAIEWDKAAKEQQEAEQTTYTVTPPGRFKMDAAGNLTRVED